MSDEYRRGYRDGYRDGVSRGDIADIVDASMRETSRGLPDQWMSQPKRKPRKRPTSKKQKLLKTMTDKKWKTYKGKKTWIQIRAQVSRSQANKKKARRL